MHAFVRGMHKQTQKPNLLQALGIDSSCEGCNGRCQHQVEAQRLAQPLSLKIHRPSPAETLSFSVSLTPLFANVAQVETSLRQQVQI